MLVFYTPLSLLLFHPPGLPKPAILTHERVLQVSRILPMNGVTADDVVYTVLPLYHVMGLVLGVLSCLELGKPFPEDPSNPWGCQTGCQGYKASRVTQHAGFLPLTRDTQQRALGLRGQRLGYPDSP